VKSSHQSTSGEDLRHFPNRDFDWHREKLTIAQRELLRKDAAKVQFSRNLRREELDEGILGEPAWDILLALFVIDNDRRRISLGELSRTAKIPQTTTLRWVAALEDRDLARKRPNPLDQRAVQVELTDKGRASMESYFMLMRKAAVFG
jgi:DNA-binding MarR family transcriptional regulator